MSQPLPTLPQVLRGEVIVSVREDAEWTVVRLGSGYEIHFPAGAVVVHPERPEREVRELTPEELRRPCDAPLRVRVKAGE